MVIIMMTTIKKEKKEMNIGLLKEKLEIKSFILDANLYLVTNTFYLLVVVVGILYLLLCFTYSKGIVDLFIFASVSSITLVLGIFIYIGHKSILRQRSYIKDLDSFMDQYLNKDGEYEL